VEARAAETEQGAGRLSGSWRVTLTQEVWMDDLRKPMFWVLVVLAVLIAIVVVGNWQLYPRMERLEKTLGLRAPQQ